MINMLNLLHWKEEWLGTQPQIITYYELKQKEKRKEARGQE